MSYGSRREPRNEQAVISSNRQSKKVKRL
jgi:hypothetical protein